MDFGEFLADPALAADLRSGLGSVEELLRTSVKSDYEFVTETSEHLLGAGGKRFRPLLVLLASHFADPSSPGIVPAAVAVELTHLSTLYHDDVIDEASLRRGAQSANARWTNTIAILTGDFLFARASEITADLGTEATRILSRTIARLCEGEIREAVGPRPQDDPVDHYLQVVREKTASLIACSARFGALLSGADPAVVEILTRYGDRIGVAFQLSDDVLDITGDSDHFGKVPGTDLREGVQTLPVLLALRGDDHASMRLRELLSFDSRGDAAVHEALSLLRAHPAIDDARSVVRQWAEEACAVIGPLPAGAPRATLEKLCDFVVDRTA